VGDRRVPQHAGGCAGAAPLTEWALVPVAGGPTVIDRGSYVEQHSSLWGPVDEGAVTPMRPLA
jgi:hypothetical protein